MNRELALDMYTNNNLKTYIEQWIAKVGFESYGHCDTTELRIIPEVRDMCAEDKCNSYKKSWSCPPACGTLDSFETLLRNYRRCFVFQTVYAMEDEFDFEAMLKANTAHSRRFTELTKMVNNSAYDIALLSAGSCKLCGSNGCTCPDAPCRHPDLMRPSMEAAGLLVSEACVAANIPYHHGSCTMTFTSCALL